MKKNIKRFTLVEMLTVVAIIGILAGIIIPTVIIAQNRGRETQAKTDISSIMTAIKQVKTDYNLAIGKKRHVHFTKNGKSGDAARQIIAANPSGMPDYFCLIDQNAYDAFIAELSVPKNLRIDKEKINERINKRRKVYLDPKNGFNPNEEYDSDNNIEKLYRDPWGNRYIIYLNITGKPELQLYDTEDDLTIATDIAVYSCGPNGEDDRGCNAMLDSCIKSGDKKNHKNHDDIASWNL